MIHQSNSPISTKRLDNSVWNVPICFIFIECSVFVVHLKYWQFFLQVKEIILVENRFFYVALKFYYRSYPKKSSNLQLFFLLLLVVMCSFHYFLACQIRTPHASDTKTCNFLFFNWITHQPSPMSIPTKQNIRNKPKEKRVMKTKVY